MSILHRTEEAPFMNKNIRKDVRAALKSDMVQWNGLRKRIDAKSKELEPKIAASQERAEELKLECDIHIKIIEKWFHDLVREYNCVDDMPDGELESFIDTVANSQPIIEQQCSEIWKRITNNKETLFNYASLCSAQWNSLAILDDAIRSTTLLVEHASNNGTHKIETLREKKARLEMKLPPLPIDWYTDKKSARKARRDYHELQIVTERLVETPSISERLHNFLDQFGHEHRILSKIYV